MKTPLLFLALLLTATPLAAAEAERPNILFVFADDWGRYASAYAKLEPGGPNDCVSTPNFDRIAREGVLFTNAFVNAPSCTPCRSSLLSGQYFWRTGRGAILQGAVWDEAIPSWPLLLQAGGYHIGQTHKVWSPGTPANAPFGARANSYNRRGGAINSYSQQVMRAQDRAAKKEQILAEVLGNFQDCLADRKAGQPFCYWFGPTNCHRKWIQGSGKELWGIDPDSLQGKLPPFLPDVPVIREDFADYLGEVQALDAALGVLLAELERIGELERTLIVVSGDHGAPGFPRGKCNLYDFGCAVSLAVRWGEQVPAGRVVEDFVNLPDLGPTLLAAAGLETPEVMTGRSILPLLRSEKSGTLDPERDAVILGRERHVARARAGNLPYPQRAIRTREFLYIRNFEPERWPMGDGPARTAPASEWPTAEALRENTFSAFGDLDASPTKAYIAIHRNDEGMEPYYEFAFGRRPAEELYDLRSDPHQLKNLAADPNYEATREKLSTRLLATLRATGDPRVAGDGQHFEQPPFAGE